MRTREETKKFFYIESVCILCMNRNSVYMHVYVCASVYVCMHSSICVSNMAKERRICYIIRGILCKDYRRMQSVLEKKGYLVSDNLKAGCVQLFLDSVHENVTCEMLVVWFRRFSPNYIMWQFWNMTLCSCFCLWVHI